jgi:hypothetical protein
LLRPNQILGWPPSYVSGNGAAVIRAARQQTAVLRHVWLTLATLAIALKILVPPGFMAAASSADPRFALTLCHGEATMPGDGPMRHDHDGRTPAKGVHHAPCVFAGHGLGVPAPNALEATIAEYFAFDRAPTVAVRDLAPGRGLAGPPLPARGPPVLLI